MGKFLFCEDEANIILSEVEREFNKLGESTIKMCIFCSQNPAFSSYEKQIYKKAGRFKNLEIVKFKYDLKNNPSADRIIEDISYVGKDDNCVAIFLESFLQKFLRDLNIDFYNYLPYTKDLEAIHPYNLGRIFLGENEHLPPTVSAILRIIGMIEKDLKGKKVVIVNHSEIIGKPLALALLQSKTNAPTVTICHIGTANLQEETRKGDFLITAIGVPKFFNAYYIKEGAVVIDVGFTKLGTQVFGDVDVESIMDKASLITPVPKGVGMLTLTYFFYNILCCLKKQGKL